MDSSDVEDAIRLAVSLGGDADTQAAIAGGIAEAFYKCVPATIVSSVRERLPPGFIDVIDAFRQAFPLGGSVDCEGGDGARGLPRATIGFPFPWHTWSDNILTVGDSRFAEFIGTIGSVIAAGLDLLTFIGVSRLLARVRSSSRHGLNDGRVLMWFLVVRHLG